MGLPITDTFQLTWLKTLQSQVLSVLQDRGAVRPHACSTHRCPSHFFPAHRLPLVVPSSSNTPLPESGKPFEWLTHKAHVLHAHNAPDRQQETFFSDDPFWGSIEAIKLLLPETDFWPLIPKTVPTLWLTHTACSFSRKSYLEHLKK